MRAVRPALFSAFVALFAVVSLFPVAWVFERVPKAYHWNKELSGQDAPELPVIDTKEIPVRCRYTGSRPVDFTELYERP